MLTRVWPVILIAFFLSTPVTWAELTADQVAIIANRNSAESQAVAWHYAERRGLKREQIITLDLPKDETITREDYEQEVVRPLRRILEERKLAARIKCLVTTYGVPLHIRAPEPTSKEQRWAKDAAVRKEQALVHLGSLERQIKDIGAPASPDGSRAESPEIAPANPSSLNRVTLAIQEAAQRVNATTDLEKAQKDRQALSGLIQQFGGTAALLQFIPTVAPEESEKYRRQGTTAQAIVRVLSSAPSDRNRERAYGLAKEVFGLRGTLTLAEDELLRFSYNEGDASLDSELTLVWWDLGTYRIAGRIPNPLFHNANPGVDKTSRSETELPVLMVTRLDAPTAELAMRLVDRALEAEQRGLEGKVYLDAQGMENSSTMSSGFYDQSLRDSADVIRKATAYEVVLENTQRRFSQPGEAPDVALYAFSFNPGAIGYHIASGEAVSLHNPAETGWCKNALEHGITATVGSTGEPYLDAFPLPKDFVTLLLTGHFSLVETYFLTSRYISWRMVLVGDPLYSPWRGMQLTKVTKDSPIPPSDRTFPDPLEARKRYKSQFEVTLVQVERLMDQLEEAGKKQPAKQEP